MTERIVFLDLETTGLDPARHEIWEIGAIVRERGDDVEYLWRIEPDLPTADPNGLRVSRFYERTDRHTHSSIAGITNLADGTTKLFWSRPANVAHQLARLLDGAHIVGAVPSFDAEFLKRFLPRYGQAYTAHYHLIDVEAMAVGYLHGIPDEKPPFPHQHLPWDSNGLSRALGLRSDVFDRHTALGDARWARAQYDAITTRRDGAA